MNFNCINNEYNDQYVINTPDNILKNPENNLIDDINLNYSTEDYKHDSIFNCQELNYYNNLYNDFDENNNYFIKSNKNNYVNNNEVESYSSNNKDKHNIFDNTSDKSNTTVLEINSVTTNLSNSYNSLSDKNCVLSINNNSSNNNNNNNYNNTNYNLNKKKGRPMTDNKAIKISNCNKVIKPEDDLKEYMKARKQQQNRESQYRTRLRKKEEITKLFIDKENLEKENQVLKIENRNLIQDRDFLKEQIKFLQTLINNKLYSKTELPSDSSSSTSANLNKNKDIESLSFVNNSSNKNNNNNNNNNKLSLSFGNNSNKSKLNRIFTISLICILGMLNIVVNYDNDSSNNNNNNNINILNSGSNYSLKSEYTSNFNNGNITGKYNALTRLFTLVIFILTVLYAFILYGKEYVDRRKKVK